MGFDDLTNLFFIRHGDDTNGYDSNGWRCSLNPTLKKVRKMAEEDIIRTLKLVSSCERKAIRTALDIGESVGAKRLFTTDQLCEAESPMKLYAELDQLIEGDSCLVVGHSETVDAFPSYLIRKKFEKTGIPMDFGYYYGSGIYINFKTGEWERI